MQRILSGIRPTGGIHIGNYLGSIHQWVELSNEPDSECFFAIVDYHALMSFRDTPLDVASLDLLAWQLTSGLDPNKVTLFLQSGVPAHTELAWIFNAFITVAELGRMTQYKDLIHQGTEQPTSALFTYPVLQAADILLYKTTLVPVGEDQVQHIELARTIAQRVNKHGEIFPLPKARLTSTARVMSLHDPAKKMAKSFPQGAILMTDEPDIIRHKIMRAVTDSTETGPFAETELANLELNEAERSRLYETMTPGLRNLFLLLDATSNKDTVDQFLRRYSHKTLHYKELKEALANSLIAFLTPMQARYKEIRTDEANLKVILTDGTARASTIANTTLKEIKQLFHFLEI